MLLDIFIHIASPIINNTATKNIIPKSTLNVPPICSNKDTIFLSAIGSHIAPAKWYVIVSIDNFIIGSIHIPIIINIPTTPIEFFKIAVEPSTISTESPNAFPTTGISVDAVVFIPFAVKPSTLLVRVPSKDKILTNIVITNPKNHVILDFKNLDNFPICIFSDKLDMIPNAVAINVSGNINNVIVFPINTVVNKINGCIKETDATLP